VVGLLAQLGARMIQEVSNKMFEEFTRNLRTQLQQERVAGTEQSSTSGTASQPQPIKAVPLVLTVARESAGRLFRRIFRGSGPG